MAAQQIQWIQRRRQHESLLRLVLGKGTNRAQTWRWASPDLQTSTTHHQHHLLPRLSERRTSELRLSGGGSNVVKPSRQPWGGQLAVTRLSLSVPSQFLGICRGHFRWA